MGAWSNPTGGPYNPSPLFWDGRLYVLLDRGLVSCFDAKTGQEYRSHRIKGDVWGSTLAADGKVYVGTQRGAFYVFAAGKEKRLLSTIELDSPMNSSPAAAFRRSQVPWPL